MQCVEAAGRVRQSQATPLPLNPSANKSLSKKHILFNWFRHVDRKWAVGLHSGGESVMCACSSSSPQLDLLYALYGLVGNSSWPLNNNMSSSGTNAWDDGVKSWPDPVLASTVSHHQHPQTSCGRSARSAALWSPGTRGIKARGRRGRNEARAHLHLPGSARAAALRVGADRQNSGKTHITTVLYTQLVRNVWIFHCRCLIWSWA